MLKNEKSLVPVVLVSLTGWHSIVYFQTERKVRFFKVKYFFSPVHVRKRALAVPVVSLTSWHTQMNDLAVVKITVFRPKESSA